MLHEVRSRVKFTRRTRKDLTENVRTRGRATDEQEEDALKA